MRDNFLQERTFKFAVNILRLCRDMQKNGDYVLSKQLLKSGTSVGANIREANYAISKAEFVAKFQIALKEAAETEYWLLLLIETESDNGYYKEHCTECNAIKRILIKSSLTAKTKEI